MTVMKTFEFEVNGAGRKETVRLASVSPKDHMNIIVKDDDTLYSCVTLNADKVKEVRDALIRAYPLEEKKPEPSEYTVRPSAFTNEWVVERAESKVVEEVVIVARTLSEDYAKKIAQALNEAEGL